MQLAQKQSFDHPRHMAMIEAAFQLVGAVLQSILDYAPGQASWEKIAKAAEAERQAQSPLPEQDGLAGQKLNEKSRYFDGQPATIVGHRASVTPDLIRGPAFPVIQRSRR